MTREPPSIPAPYDLSPAQRRPYRYWTVLCALFLDYRKVIKELINGNKLFQIKNVYQFHTFHCNISDIISYHIGNFHSSPEHLTNAKT